MVEEGDGGGSVVMEGDGGVSVVEEDEAAVRVEERLAREACSGFP